MQVGQGLAIGEPPRLRNEAFDQREQPIGPVDKPPQHLSPVHGSAGATFIKPMFGPGRFVSRRQKEKGEEVAALEVSARLFELSPALLIDQTGDRIGKAALRIGLGGIALGLDEDCPTGTKPTEGVVHPGGGRDQLGGCRRVEIRSAELGSALKRAVLVQYHAGFDQRGPGKKVGQGGRMAAIFAEIEHGGLRPKDAVGRARGGA